MSTIIILKMHGFQFKIFFFLENGERIVIWLTVEMFVFTRKEPGIIY